MTDWFSFNSGLKQGFILSPVMFNTFLDVIKVQDIGEDIDRKKLGYFYILMTLYLLLKMK